MGRTQLRQQGTLLRHRLPVCASALSFKTPRKRHWVSNIHNSFTTLLRAQIAFLFGDEDADQEGHAGRATVWGSHRALSAHAALG